MATVSEDETLEDPGSDLFEDWYHAPVTDSAAVPGFHVRHSTPDDFGARYYSQAFDEVFGLLSAEGVEIIDYDPFDPAAEPIGRFDFVSLMAALEHYPHSPRHLLENVKRMLNPTGTCYIEVPNIAYWPKRIGLLFGEMPLPDISEIYRSEVPSTGHHHEYTMRQLNEVTVLAGSWITGRATYNYSIRSLSLRGAIRRPVVHFLGAITDRLFPNTRELIAVRCRVSH